MMIEQLKPCPFCGGEAVTHNSCDGFYVSCVKCDCEVGAVHGMYDVYGEYDTEAEAIRAWNTRALPAAPAVRFDIEAMARQIYASMVFANQLEKASEKEAAWVENGNSLVQQEARACACRILAALE